MTDKFDIEKALNNLEKIVEQLEEQDSSLEETISLYREGIQLLNQCTDNLEKAEKDIIIINKENDDNS
ncbi:MAG: exodeoxyribonuclease VII small subunit [Eubacteriales bacterium]